MFWKQGIADEEALLPGAVYYVVIILIRTISSSKCLRMIKIPLIRRLLKYSKSGDSVPPIISRYS